MASTRKPAQPIDPPEPPAPPSPKPHTAWSLHIGLNAVNPAHYGGWSGPLNACEADALDMQALAKTRGMKPVLLLTKQGTRAKVLAGIRKAAKALKAGDLFLLTYSGHGGQVPDGNGDEPDKRDETWCLYDGQLVDDELYLELSRFRSGVRVVVLSDSCHSGTVTRERRPPPAPVPPGYRAKLMPDEIANRTYRDNQAFYDRLQAEVLKAAGTVVDPDTVLGGLAGTVTGGLNPQIVPVLASFKSAVLLISGCMDNQVSLDGPHNGAFTGRLLQVWNQGKFKGSYAAFHATIKAGMPATQTPNLFTLGAAGPLVNQAPFTP